jgi:protein phosphatase PTC7
LLTGQRTLSESIASGTPIGAYFYHGEFMIPHFEKRNKGGEDAYVSNENLLIVADGVGGWVEQGIDPGLFSKLLVKNIDEEYRKNPSNTLKNMLIEAVKRDHHIGSSTAVLAAFDLKKD